MNTNELIKKVEALHSMGEHSEIIKLIEGSNNVTPSIISLLARAYQNLDEPNFLKAYELLKSCEDELIDEASFNFRMAYNLYYRDIIARAKMHFEKALENGKGESFKDDTLEFIKDCNHRVSLGVTDVTLNERINGFWSDFSSDIELYKLAKSDSQENATLVIDKIQHLLEKNSLSASVEIGMGKQFDKPHIVLSPEGLFLNLIIYKQILSLMPDEINERYNFSIGRNRGRNFAFKMNGIELDSSNVEIAYTASDDSIDIYLKNEPLAKLYKENENVALNIAYIFTDSFFGELFCMRHVASVNIDDKEGLDYRPIGELVDEILDKYKGESYDDYPYNSYSSYSLGENEDIQKVRDDIIAGTTCLLPLIGDYLSEETYTFDTSFDSGVVYTSLIFDIGDINPSEALKKRHEMENLLVEKEGDIFKLIGGAFGVYSMYTDLVVFDMKRFKSEIIDYYIDLAKQRGVKNAFFGVIRSGEEVFTLFDDNKAE